MSFFRVDTMAKKDLPVDIYHRIYRLAARKIPIERIAVTLNLPFSTVRRVVDYLFSSSPKGPSGRENDKNLSLSEIKNSAEKQPYLDIYLLQRLRYVVVDLNGMVIEIFKEMLQTEFTKLLSSDRKAAGILLSNVKAIDDTGFSTIVSFYDSFANKGRYCALLDPSKEIEQFISAHLTGKNIPVFGTEKAFEEDAFKTKVKKTKKI
jgi:anti-anti-sigma regulatory factor